MDLDLVYNCGIIRKLSKFALFEENESVFLQKPPSLGWMSIEIGLRFIVYLGKLQKYNNYDKESSPIFLFTLSVKMPLNKAEF